MKDSEFTKEERKAALREMMQVMNKARKLPVNSPERKALFDEYMVLAEKYTIGEGIGMSDD